MHTAPRLVVVAALAALGIATATAACSKSASSQDKGAPPPAPAAGGTAEKIAVPGGEGAPAAAGAPAAQVDDPKRHLQPEEGTLTIEPASGKAGAELVAAVKVAPGAGYHISTDFPVNLSLEAPAGVTLAKAELAAGKGEQGDAQSLTEQGLAFAVKATAAKAGSYELKGWFKFGVCDKESCHPKKQPITIAVAAQ